MGIAFLRMWDWVQRTLQKKPSLFKRREDGCRNTLWNAEVQDEGRQLGRPLHLSPSPAILSWFCLWVEDGHRLESYGLISISGFAYLCLWRLDLNDSARETFTVQQKDKVEAAMYCGIQDEGSKASWLSTASVSTQSHLDLVEDMQLFFTLNTITIQAIGHHQDDWIVLLSLWLWLTTDQHDLA